MTPATSLVRLDEQYRRALVVVIEAGRASVSTVQRKLCIGYNEAQELVARMVRDGLISIEDTPGVPADMVAPTIAAPASIPPVDSVLRKALKALEQAIEWDKGRNFVVPYKVRDPMVQAIAEIRSTGMQGENHG